jgi:hypothetical protein
VVRTPLPSSERFTLRLDWKALGWLRGEPQEAEAIDEDGKGPEPTAIRAHAGGECLLACEPGVFAYRLKGPGETRAASAAR